jgi:hypothetical protein
MPMLTVVCGRSRIRQPCAFGVCGNGMADGAHTKALRHERDRLLCEGARVMLAGFDKAFL